MAGPVAGTAATAKATEVAAAGDDSLILEIKGEKYVFERPWPGAV